MRVAVIGAGIAGLTCALELVERGVSVEVFERSDALGSAACSWQAGGMLAPWCEREASEPVVARLGEESIAWWAERVPMVRRGTLVLAHGRDVAELRAFARKTERFEWVDGERIAELEPDLAGRFRSGLYFESEAHVDPRVAMTALGATLCARGAKVHFGAEIDVRTATESSGARVVDCRGVAARDTLRDLRAVKGEMLLLRLPELTLSRPIRILHPRVPIYVIPRGEGVFMIGATSIESDARTGVTARSALELLSAAYALHPAFAEAEIIELGTGLRPAFQDNLPRIRRHNGITWINGLYRHGFLLAPALARRLAAGLLDDRWDPEVMDEDHPQRRLA